MPNGNGQTVERTITFLDFTAGLWEPGSDLAAPPNSLRQLDDAFPLPQGGLRAGPRWTEEDTTNLPAAQVLIGLQDSFVENSLNPYHILVATIVRGTPDTARTISLWQQRLNAPALGDVGELGAWNTPALKTHTDVRRYIPLRFVLHLSDDTGGINKEQARWYYVIQSGTATERGIWRFANEGLDSTPIQRVDEPDAIFFSSFQSRMIIASFLPGESRVGRIKFSDPNVDNALPADNRVDPTPEAPSDIVALSPVHPSDLLVLKSSHGLFLVQSNLRTPQTRELVTLHPPAAQTNLLSNPAGIAYLTPDRGVWVFRGGNATVHLSPQITNPMTAVYKDSRGATFGFAPPPYIGDTHYCFPWLFTPGGYVFDIRTEAWWKTSLPNLSATFMYPFWTSQPRTRVVRAAGTQNEAGGEGGAITIASAKLDETEMKRATSWTAALPVVELDARRASLQEVEFHVESFAATSRIDLTVEHQGTTIVKQADTIGTGVQVVRFPIRRTSDWFKISFTISSGSATVEAPFLHRVNVTVQEETQHQPGTSTRITTVFLNDTFTDANNTLLQNHTPDQGGAWEKLAFPTNGRDAEIVSNTVRSTDATFLSVAYRNAEVPPRAEYDVKATFNFGAAMDAGTEPSLYARMNAIGTADTDVDRYEVRYTPGPRTYQLLKQVGTSSTVLDSFAIDEAGAGEVEIVFKVRDATKQVFRNGVEIMSSADNEITQVGRVGLKAPRNDSHVDDFQVSA